MTLRANVVAGNPGVWAGSGCAALNGSCTGCASIDVILGTCANSSHWLDVNNNPEQFIDTFWGINSLRVFT